MDYKELIEYNALIEDMRAAADVTGVCEVELNDAATAIETLLAEREALMELIYGKCELCINRRKCLFDDEARRDCALNKCRNWQWRGPAPPDRQQAEMRG